MRGKMGRLIEFMHGRMKPQSTSDALHIAAFEGDLEQIQILVNFKKADVDVMLSTVMGGSTLQTPLFLAIQEGNVAAAKLLVELGAKVDLVNDIGISPLMSAASHGDLKLVNFLLSLSASPNFFRIGDGATALSFATHVKDDKIASEIAAVLVAAGADVELPLERPQSVLMLAARANLPNVIEVLLRAGAKPERQCKLKWATSWTALDHAINEQSIGAMEVLAAITKTPPIATPGCVS